MSTTTPTLEELRADISAIDQQIAQLLQDRARTAIQIGQAKQGRAIYDPARERQVLAAVSSNARGPLSAAAMSTIYREVIAACRALQQPLSVAYLGPAGTYSEIAARQLLGNNTELQPYSGLDELMRATESGQATMGILPIENSTEGAVNRSLDLLLATKLRITAELYLHINHQLLSHANELSAVQVVSAHPQALAQCKHWLADHLPQARLEPNTSNAAAAEAAAGDPTRAAIASEQASVQYELPILAPGIADQTNNTTRFVLVSNISAGPTDADKTSLVCSVPNVPGSLSKLLAIIARQGLNMTKLESRPSNHQLWDYIFYIDIDGHEQDPPVQTALQELREYATFVHVLGSYPKALPKTP